MKLASASGASTSDSDTDERRQRHRNAESRTRQQACEAAPAVGCGAVSVESQGARHSICQGHGVTRRVRPCGALIHLLHGHLSHVLQTVRATSGQMCAAPILAAPCACRGPSERVPGPSSRRGSPRPALRRRVKLPAGAVLAAAALAPPALAVACRRAAGASVGVCALEHVGLPGRLRDAARRPRASGAARADRLPDRRRPRARARGAADASASSADSRPRARSTASSGCSCWCHWIWFAVPHGSVLYVLLRRPERFPRAAARMYAVFDLGAVFYWAIPTAPPW